jgi:hypothetical protein
MSAKHRPTVTLLMGCPEAFNSSAMVRVDLLVHFSGLMGSPAVVSSTMFFSPPGQFRAHLLDSLTAATGLTDTSFGRATQLTPPQFSKTWVMVTQDIPVNRDSRLIPPRLS